MKKFTKISLIIVLVLVCVGVAVGAIGFAIGGTRLARGIVQEKIGNFLQHNYSTEVTYNNDFDIHMDNWDSEDEKIYTGIVKNEVIAANEEVKSMELSIGAAEIKVLFSATDDYSIDSNTIGEYRCYVKDGTLILEGIRYDNLTIRDNESITLYVPENAEIENITVSVGAGDVEIDTIKAKQLEIAIGAGKLTIGDLVADDLLIELAAGECIIENMDLKNGKTDVSMGNIMLAGIITGDMEVDCAMGNVTLMIDGDEEDFNYEIDCALGNVNVVNSGMAVIVGENYQNNHANKTLTISCAMGNVEVDFQ